MHLPRLPSLVVRGPHRIGLGLALILGLACAFRTQEVIVTELSEGCAMPSQGELTVGVGFATCLSSSCDTLRQATCTLEEADGVITVRGEATIDSQVGGACTDDCGFVSASCTIDLPPGDYTLRVAGQEYAITHPVTETVGECNL